MRYFVVLSLVVIGILYLRQTKNETPAVVSPSPATQASSPHAPANSPHWPAASINRAHTVAQQVKDERAANSEP
ncbi:MAG: hypothetical protein ABI839_00220 [Verrucomicrobiota bacterium]